MTASNTVSRWTVRLLILILAVFGFAQQPSAATISWLSTSLAVVTNDPATAALRPARCCGLTTPFTAWCNLEKPGNQYDFTPLDACLAQQSGRVVILVIHYPPADVTASTYVTRIARFVSHLAGRYSTAKNNLWIQPDNEPDISSDGFNRHAQILSNCYAASKGRLKIVGCALQDAMPAWFQGLAKLGCARWCDAIAFHNYRDWQMAPDLPWTGADPHGMLYDDLQAIKALFPGKPIYCNEFGVTSDTERTQKSILLMLAAGVQLIQPFEWGRDMNLHYPDESVARFHGDDVWPFYGCWNYTYNRPAPWAQCVVDFGNQIGSNPKATLTRTTDGVIVVAFTNGEAYTWNTNAVAKPPVKTK